MLRETQARFRTALLGADDAPLAGVAAGCGGVPLARRIAVHRNTVLGTLTDALAAAFPVVQRLVGDAFFAAAARAFIQASPPPRPDLTAFGDGFASFLEGFPPASGVPYLGAVGRLEWARVEASFAADAAPLNLDALAAVPAEAVPGLVFTPHPAARRVAESWPVQAIWDAHQTETVAPVDLDAGGEAVVILRPADRLITLRLAPAADAAVAALFAGSTLAVAAQAALARDPAFDLLHALAALLQHGAFADARVQPVTDTPP